MDGQFSKNLALPFWPAHGSSQNSFKTVVFNFLSSLLVRIIAGVETQVFQIKNFKSSKLKKVFFLAFSPYLTVDSIERGNKGSGRGA